MTSTPAPITIAQPKARLDVSKDPDGTIRTVRFTVGAGDNARCAVLSAEEWTKLIATPGRI